MDVQLNLGCIPADEFDVVFPPGVALPICAVKEQPENRAVHHVGYAHVIGPDAGFGYGGRLNLCSGKWQRVVAIGIKYLVKNQRHGAIRPATDVVRGPFHDVRLPSRPIRDEPTAFRDIAVAEPHDIHGRGRFRRDTNQRSRQNACNDGSGT